MKIIIWIPDEPHCSHCFFYQKPLKRGRSKLCRYLGDTWKDAGKHPSCPALKQEVEKR